jgi:lysine 2,3-aminomutase
MKRFWRYKDVTDEQWTDWKWQMRNRLWNKSSIWDFFPKFNSMDAESFASFAGRFSLGLTPYILSLIELDGAGNPLPDDPIWNQFRFLYSRELIGADVYDGVEVNWEKSEELPTRILHHKYPDRAIIRTTHQCFGKCNYCYLTSRVLDLKTINAKAGDQSAWEESLAYLQRHAEIRDVLLSGGDPLILSNELIDKLFCDLARIPSIRSIRLNTRALTFNPYRFDRDLVDIFKKNRLTALEIHLAHPKEITEAFDEALARFEQVGYRPMILWRSPLLRGINDSYDVLQDLLLKLYQRRIVPYYIFHYAPYSLGRANLGVGIKEGIRLLARLRRIIPGPAFPRYTLFHPEGKQDIPLEPEGTSEFRFARNNKGEPIVKFKNWKGKWVTYLDIVDNGMKVDNERISDL